MPIGDANRRAISKANSMSRVYNAATRVLVTGGAGFLGSHLCDRLLATRRRRALRRQFVHRQQAQYRASARQSALRVPAARRDLSALCRGRRDLQSRLPGLARPLPARSGADDQDQRASAPSTCWAWPSACRRKIFQASTSRSLWRSRRPSADRGLLGPRQSDRPALLLRRRQALRRDAVLRLSPAARSRRSRSRAFSTPMARACIRTTGAWSRTSSSRRLKGRRSRSTATAPNALFCYVDDLIDGLVRADEAATIW